MRLERDSADTPEAREARILALIDKYERLGAHENRQAGHRPKQTQIAEAIARAKAEAERRGAA